MNKLAPFQIMPFLAFGLITLASTTSKGGVSVVELYGFPYQFGQPTGLVAAGPDGNLYVGRTDGTILQIGTNSFSTNLFQFTNGIDGGSPTALAQAPDGFFGTASGGGAAGFGTIFTLSTNGVFTSVYAFSNGVDGANPNELIAGTDGYYYGTTSSGGTSNLGTLFRIDTNGTFFSLFSLTNSQYGQSPFGILQTGDGKIYGAASGGPGGFGTLFQFSTNGALAPLWYFRNDADGGGPNQSLALGPDGAVYGTTFSGGTSGVGTVFRCTTTLSTIHSFSFGTDGGYPKCITMGGNGLLYGATGSGVVFTITPTGILTPIGTANTGSTISLVPGPGSVLFGVASAEPHGQAYAFEVVFSPSQLQFGSITVQGGTVNLSWPADLSQQYLVQYSSDLQTGSWTNLGGPQTAYELQLNAFDSTSSGSTRFYRLVRLRSP